MSGSDQSQSAPDTQKYSLPHTLNQSVTRDENVKKFDLGKIAKIRG
jgi:hypothetical protein